MWVAKGVDACAGDVGLLERVTAGAGPGRAGTGEVLARGRGDPGSTSRAAAWLPDPQEFTVCKPILHRNRGSPGDPRIPSGQNFHPCLHCKFSTRVQKPREGREQLITVVAVNLQGTLGTCQAPG